MSFLIYFLFSYLFDCPNSESTNTFFKLQIFYIFITDRLLSTLVSFMDFEPHSEMYCFLYSWYWCFPCCTLPWSHGSAGSSCEGGHASFLMEPPILWGSFKSFSLCVRLAECHSFVPRRQPQTHRQSGYFLILPVAFHLRGHFKRRCIVNSLHGMRSNTYRASPAALSITINVSSPLHPLHTFITLLEMSDVFATVARPRGKEKAQSIFYPLFLFIFF